MNFPTMTVLIPAPRVGAEKLTAIAKLTLRRLCSIAEIPLRVSGPDRIVNCIAGNDHFILNGQYYVGVGPRWQGTRISSLKVLEILAHGFHDYAARECVCGRGLFALPKRRGRPTNGRRAMTARERMKLMRQRRSAAGS